MFNPRTIEMQAELQKDQIWGDLETPLVEPTLAELLEPTTVVKHPAAIKGRSVDYMRDFLALKVKLPSTLRVGTRFKGSKLELYERSPQEQMHDLGRIFLALRDKLPAVVMEAVDVVILVASMHKDCHVAQDKLADIKGYKSRPYFNEALGFVARLGLIIKKSQKKKKVGIACRYELTDWQKDPLVRMFLAELIPALDRPIRWKWTLNESPQLNIKVISSSYSKESSYFRREALLTDSKSDSLPTSEPPHTSSLQKEPNNSQKGEIQTIGGLLVNLSRSMTGQLR
jgi:hypothetical protein